MSKKRTYTEAELAQAWSYLMFGPEDWQGKICCQVKTPHVDAIVASILHYTGCEAIVYPVPGGDSKIMAPGYRQGPWKDKIPEKVPPRK